MREVPVICHLNRPKSRLRKLGFEIQSRRVSGRAVQDDNGFSLQEGKTAAMKLGGELLSRQSRVHKAIESFWELKAFHSINFNTIDISFK
jgi:hypothetical protein